MDAPQTASDSKSGVRRALGLSRGLSILAQLSWLFTLAGFLLSAGINTLLFRQWGLSFLQIASPSDVLMSGTALIVPMIGLLLLMTMMTAAWSYASSKWFHGIHDSIRANENGAAVTAGAAAEPRERVPQFTRANALYWLAFATLVGLTTVVSYVQSQRLLVPFLADWMVYLAVAGGSSMILAGGLSVHREYKKDRLFAALPIAVGFFGFAIIWLGLASYLDLAARDGFTTRPFSVDPSPAVCGSSNRLLWTGSQASVVACLDHRACPVRIVVIRDVEKVTFAEVSPSLGPTPKQSLFGSFRSAVADRFRRRCVR